MSRSRKDIKEEAQDMLMHSVRLAFNKENPYNTTDQEVIAEMDKQMRRIEKLFGYETGSWKRDGMTLELGEGQ